MIIKGKISTDSRLIFVNFNLKNLLESIYKTSLKIFDQVATFDLLTKWG